MSSSFAAIATGLRSAPKAPWLGHIPALDGLRGLAILMVMFSHFSILGGLGFAATLALRFVGCGAFGVDLFFVLSGFLITGILLDTKQAPHALRNFYMRRTLRIFPLNYAVLLAFYLFALVVPMSYVHAKPAMQFQSVLHDWPWYATYTSNVLIGSRNNSGHGFLTVTWSLSIEEQYYLIWAPLVLMLRPRTVIRLSVLLLAASLAARCLFILSGASPLQIYVSSICRADGLALGSYYAAVVRRDGFSQRKATARAKLVLTVALPLLVFLACFGALNTKSLFCRTIGYTLIAGTFSQMLVLAIDKQTRMAWILRFRFLGWFGVYSYGLYLLHTPMRSALDKLWPTGDAWRNTAISGLASQALFTTVGIAATMILALVARRVIEEPALRLKRYFPRERNEEVGS
jgi:peptidoglycan/LPS O-acetylase OafA/YrhL